MTSANWFDIKILFQPAASRPEGPAAPLVLSIAFFLFSASIEWNLIGWISCLVAILLDLQTLSCGCFCFIWYKLWPFNERTPFCMLFAKSFIALLILPFLMSRVDFLDISAMVDGVCVCVFILFHRIDFFRLQRCLGHTWGVRTNDLVL